jgi:hypothetical protein
MEFFLVFCIFGTVERDVGWTYHILTPHFVLRHIARNFGAYSAVLTSLVFGFSEFRVSCHKVRAVAKCGTFTGLRVIISFDFLTVRKYSSRILVDDLNISWLSDVRKITLFVCGRNIVSSLVLRMSTTSLFSLVINRDSVVNSFAFVFKYSLWIFIKLCKSHK